MSALLSQLAPPPGSRQSEKRLGRGVGSGLGKTCGRGTKGQKARHGGNFGKLHFQGGQTPIQRRVPKRGFRKPFAEVVAEVNVGALEQFATGSEVDVVSLRGARLVQGKLDSIKILGNGELSKALTVHAHRFSQAAREKIEKAGGKVVVVASDPASGQS